MNTLADAWKWYTNTSTQLYLMRRLADKHWTDLPWNGPLGRDDEFRALARRAVVDDAEFGLEHLKDLAIVVLFSVFESSVRQYVLAEMDPEIKQLEHRVLKRAAQDVRHQVEEGSFFHVLGPFKDKHADLVEEVNQVRRYRNWVAHGKGGERPFSVDPETAFHRLNRFLTILDKESAVRLRDGGPLFGPVARVPESP